MGLSYGLSYGCHMVVIWLSYGNGQVKHCVALCQLVGAGPLGRIWLGRAGFVCKLVIAEPMGHGLHEVAWLGRLSVQGGRGHGLHEVALFVSLSASGPWARPGLHEEVPWWLPGVIS